MHVFVVVPAVFKILFDFSLNYRVEVICVIEVFEKSKKFRQLLAVTVRLVLKPFLNHIDELSHYIREERYPKQKPKGYE